MDAFEITQDMKIGWNLGNSLDATGGYGYTGLRTETSWGNPKTTKVMIDTVKAKGFNTVRIPTTWYPHLDDNNNIDSEWMARVHEIVDYAVSNDMYVILNLHHEEWVNVDQFTDATYPFFPRNNLIHDVQEFFPLRFPLSQAVLIIAECHLAHFSFSPAFSSFFYYTILFAA